MYYIQIGGKRIELTKEQAEKLSCCFTDDEVLGSVPVGETRMIGGYEFIILEHTKDETSVLLKGLLHEEEVFGENNNFDGSNVDKLCDTFYEVIAGIIGKDAFVEHTVDLTSDDGLKDYGEVRRKMSLLTTEQYRQHVDILDNYKPDRWWWLATPHSTDRHENSSWVKCVSPSGFVCDDCFRLVCGVRPFCILKSDILVSK